jgi:hypothetical protein
MFIFYEIMECFQTLLISHIQLMKPGLQTHLKLENALDYKHTYQTGAMNKYKLINFIEQILLGSQQLLTVYKYVMKSEGSLLCSQQPIPRPDPDKSHPHPHILVL